MQYGDQLYADEQFCEAYEQYQAAQTAGQLDADVAGRANQAYLACYLRQKSSHWKRKRQQHNHRQLLSHHNSY